METIYIHPSAHVSTDAQIGEGTKIWVNAQVREGVKLGKHCVISKDVYLDKGVCIGDRCKIQNSVSIYFGVLLADDVFVGPGVCFTNDRLPRAFRSDWSVVQTIVDRGASIGANSTIVCGVTIGEYAMIAAGSVVTKNVDAYSLVMGVPAVHISYVDRDGNRIPSKNNG